MQVVHRWLSQLFIGDCDESVHNHNCSSTVTMHGLHDLVSVVCCSTSNVVIPFLGYCSMATPVVDTAVAVPADLSSVDTAVAVPVGLSSIVGSLRQQQ